MIMGRLRGLNLESTYLLWRGSRADMRSIIETLQLGMPYLEEFSVEISGPDEKKAIEFLDSFFNLEIPYE
jgi:phosphotransferase system HPr-like phosphotransfer protein